MRFFCPKCWSDFPKDVARCPSCGAEILAFWRGKNYVEKLIASLNHPEPETSERAARILGNLREERAVGDLINLVSSRPDVYVARAAVEALEQIGNPQARKFLVSVAKTHKVRMVREAAERAIMHRANRSKNGKLADSVLVGLPMARGSDRHRKRPQRHTDDGGGRP